MPSRLAVLASGRGSNLQAIIDHFDNLSRERIAKVVLVAGANIAECAPITTDYLWQARENGARLIVLDPRMTPIARASTMVSGWTGSCASTKASSGSPSSQNVRGMKP